MMMDMISLFHELIATMMMLVMKPLFLCKLAVVFGLKITFIIIYTWLDLVKASVNFHLNMIWRTITWIVAIILLPVQVLTALQKETLLEQNLQVMQLEMENLVWDRKELGDHLQIAIRERKMMESMLAELEDEHDKAISKIEQLESQLQDLKDETVQLKEICSKGCWSFTGADTGNGEKVAVGSGYSIRYGIPSQKSSFKGSDMIFQDVMIGKDSWEGEHKSNTELLNFLSAGFSASGSIRPFTSNINLRNLEAYEVLNQRRGVAISQTLFSALLSLLVGMIIWEAEDPCMPLVAALFTVVGISLKSVLQLFSTIKNKPASDAVALLSFNWFILGTLTYPTLPKMARLLAPLALHFPCQMLNWFGVSLH